MGRGWGDRPVPICLGRPIQRASPRCFFLAVSFSSNFGRLAFATAYVVFDQSSVRNESWGKEMMTLANVDVIHNTQAPWGSVTGPGARAQWPPGSLPCPFLKGSFSAGPEMEFTRGEQWVRPDKECWHPQGELPFPVSWKASTGGCGGDISMWV